MQKTPFKMTAKTVALTALFAAIAVPAMAQTTVTLPSVTLYGRIDTALEFNNDGKQDRAMLQNFSSRFGIKGEREFTGDLAGVFQVETGIAPDDASQSKALASRNSYVGLRSKSLGTVIMGTHDTPFKSLDSKSLLGWGEGDLLELVIHGKASVSGIALPAGSVFTNVHTRRTNVVMYTSPKLYNVVAKLAYSPDESQNATKNQLLHSGSVEYNDGMYNVGVAYQNTLNASSSNGGTMAAIKVTAGVKMGDILVGAVYSNIDNNAGPVNGRKTDNYLLGAAYSLGPIVLKAAYATASSSGAPGKDDGLSAYTLEVDYSLDKQVTAYTYYSNIDNKQDAKGSFAAADNFPVAAAAGSKPNAFGIGIRYNF